MIGLLKRLIGSQSSKRNEISWSKDEAEIIVLYGTQYWDTEAKARSFYEGLLDAGKKVFFDEMNNYSTYENANLLVVFTSTHGVGGPPMSADKFHFKFKELPPINPLKFAVVAFGSPSYPNFCQYGIDVDNWLGLSEGFDRILPLVKVSDQSASDIRGWLSLWNRATNMEVQMELDEEESVIDSEFSVMESPQINLDNTALIKLRPRVVADFRSGDLLSIVPEGSDKPRLYSIARIEDYILLSVKKHENGICSNFLCSLKEGDTINASIKSNESFHFDHAAPSVFLIGNGTGIAPYLGMMEENSHTSLQLIWGGRSEASFDLYKPYVERAIHKGTVENYNLALSRSGHREYVQDVLSKKKEEIANAFESGGVFMLCGSMAMQDSVLEVLDNITRSRLNRPLSEFQHDGQLLKDCY
ncbi:MAG: NADPH cytochrome P450 oxidoreductase family protein [Flavobacteriales bacterium]|nr:NADPH cytochrome P450 oxidoreductase family protein [Flavobacteriales bacterium]